MNTLTLVILTILCTLALAGITLSVYNAKKANPQDSMAQSFGTAWVKIRPILSDLFINLFNLYSADQGGYDEVENFAITYIKNAIDSSDALTDEEKKILSYDFLKTILQPQLKELYNKELQK